MICLSKHEQGADLLAGYLAKTLDPAGMAELERHILDCADCRGLAGVWERLDEFTAPEVTAGFDARLYARIADEGARRPWWFRLLWPPVAPLAAASVVAVALFLYIPNHQQDAPKQAGNTADIEQVVQAVDDLDLLIPLDK